MTNERLTELIQEGGNDELLPLLWDKTRILIYKKCTQLWHFYGERLTLHGYALDDFKQEGYNALLFAVKGYDSTKGYKFTTYLNYALKHVIRNLLSGSDVLSRSDTKSLEHPLAENKNGEPLFIGDIIPDESAAEAFEDIERLDEFNLLYQAVDSLPLNLYKIIREYYFDKLTYKQIGERHGYEPERARQIHNNAIKALRHGKFGAKLRSVYGADYGISNTYRHKGLAAFKRSGTSEVEDYVLRKWGDNSEARKPKKILNAKQKKFCEEYLTDLDPEQAAIRAGYSPKTASITAAKMMTNADIKAYIREKIRG